MQKNELLENKLLRIYSLNRRQAAKMAENIREILNEQSVLVVLEDIHPLLSAYASRMETPGPTYEYSEQE